ATVVDLRSTVRDAGSDRSRPPRAPEEGTSDRGREDPRRTHRAAGARGRRKREAIGTSPTTLGTRTDDFGPRTRDRSRRRAPRTHRRGRFFHIVVGRLPRF